MVSNRKQEPAVGVRRHRVTQGGVEERSIDYIPLAERHGKAWHLGTVWFVGNAELVTFATGPIGIALGLNFAWSAVAILIGTLLGCLMMAFHSTQGPKLGLSQMIQSRAQFGYVGALLVFFFALFIFVGYTIFNTILGGQIFNVAVKLPLQTGDVLFGLLLLAITVVGYNLIHRLSRWSSLLYVTSFTIFTVIALVSIHLPAFQYSLSASTFKFAPFIIVVGSLVSYNVTWAPYVSDYSRYLPANTSTKSTFWWTYLGTAVGSVWPAVIGALVGAAFPTATTTGMVRDVGNHWFSGWGTIALVLMLPTMVLTSTLNMYSATLTTVSAIDVIHPGVRGPRWRIGSGIFMIALVVVMALVIPSGGFTSKYYAFLTIALYFLIPWTAINLVDFFVIRHGTYAIKDIFRPDGIYGRWSLRGYTAYVIGFCSMIPFMSTSVYTGPVAHTFKGGDISPFIGFPVAALVYYALSRRTDVVSERTLAEREMKELEASAPDDVG
jgi:nucleobase:cation symporter-1, NCS1 family